MPEDVHVPVVAPPLTVPPRPAVGVSEQIVWLPPALAVAAWWIVIVIDALTAPQGPIGSSVVNVTVAVPAAISDAVGM